MRLITHLNLATWFVLACTSASVALAESHTCRQSPFTVKGAKAETEMLCEAAEAIRAALAQCNLDIKAHLTIEITSDLPDGCIGQYHCGEGRIELGPLEDYASFLSNTPDSLFAHLPPRTFYESVLRHELVHAALEDMPCPYQSCRAGQEFIAYALQMWFLSETDRAPFDEAVAERDRPATADSLNAFILAMAPEKFALNAYAYFRAQDDPCAFVSSVANGTTVMDVPLQ